MNIINLFRRKPAVSPMNDTPPASLRETVVALFSSAVLEYLMDYKANNSEFIHSVAFGKMMAYRQLAIVLGDKELPGQLDEEINRVLESRRNKK